MYLRTSVYNYKKWVFLNKLKKRVHILEMKFLQRILVILIYDSKQNKE